MDSLNIFIYVDFSATDCCFRQLRYMKATVMGWLLNNFQPPQIVVNRGLWPANNKQQKSRQIKINLWIIIVRGGINFFLRNHPVVKEPETWKISLQSYCAKLQISPTIYWLSRDQNDTICRKIGDFEVDQNNHLFFVNLHWMTDYV